MLKNTLLLLSLDVSILLYYMRVLTGMLLAIYLLLFAKKYADLVKVFQVDSYSSTSKTQTLM